MFIFRFNFCNLFRFLVGFFPQISICFPSRFAFTSFVDILGSQNAQIVLLSSFLHLNFFNVIFFVLLFYKVRVRRALGTCIGEEIT